MLISSSARQKSAQHPPLKAGVRRAVIGDLCASLLLISILWLGWRNTERTIAVMIDGSSDTVHTHRRSVAGVLRDLNISATNVDLITPGLEQRLNAGAQIEVRQARRWRILADGRDFITASNGVSAQAVLFDAGIIVDPNDQVLLNGLLTGLGAILPPATSEENVKRKQHGYAWQGQERQPSQLRLRRSIEIMIDEGGLPYPVRTTAQTVGEALREGFVTLYLGDRVQPSLGSPIAPGSRIFIERSTPVTIQFDGHTRKTRTRAFTVADALSEAGILLSGLDRVEPALETALFPEIAISLTRVRNEIEVVDAITPFELSFGPDANLLIDSQALQHPGANGITRRRYRVRYENDTQLDRLLEDSWVVQEPIARHVAYGQKIVPQTLVAADGTLLTYWRKVRMYATSYTAASAGGAGVTRTGDRMRFGIVAVDPRLISLRSKVYVPGYGVGDALDTGPAVIGKHIDLGYENNNLTSWAKWVDVYLLTPVPTAGEITWVLPNFPKE